MALQGSLRHAVYSVDSPTQPFPDRSGLGLVQVLVFVLTPTLHVTEQPDHVDQSDQLPCT
ncbi:hypothetical protein DPMN_189421 [Dreissena polymorpha]|uniref:Uncharacterized protein n=1 Tax=Dreissena polymorpha TaxID=45954 RepID=A0A9D4DUA8_DREPO|nr:hypothetical protein DPMN_189421 [Dreissena polymorpha]